MSSIPLVAFLIPRLMLLRRLDAGPNTTIVGRSPYLDSSSTRAWSIHRITAFSTALHIADSLVLFASPTFATTF
jgi:hypothetical protein